MNKNNAKSYLPLVQALAEGKTIQINYRPTEGDQWGDVEDNELNWCLPPHRYRVKPEPREFLCDLDGNGKPYGLRKAGDPVPKWLVPKETIRVREVLS